MCPAWLLVFWYFWKSHFSFLYLTPSSYEIRTLLPHRTIYEVMGDQRWDECVLSPDELYSLPYSYTMSAVLVSLSREGNMPKGTCSTIRTIGRLWTTLLIPTLCPINQGQRPVKLLYNKNNTRKWFEKSTKYYTEVGGIFIGHCYSGGGQSRFFLFWLFVCCGHQVCNLTERQATPSAWLETLDQWEQERGQSLILDSSGPKL